LKNQRRIRSAGFPENLRAEAWTMPEVRNNTEGEFLNGLRGQVGRRVRVWYDVESTQGEAIRETVEGRLSSAKGELVLVESRLIHPMLAEDYARRTAALDMVRGYTELDQRTGMDKRSFVRPKLPRG
jgi:hypothetical protein